jgi:hypothetical protein
MKLEPKQLKALKVKLALEGTGAKKRLALALGCKDPQLSYILATGLVSKTLETGIINYLNSK